MRISELKIWPNMTLLSIIVIALAIAVATIVASSIMNMDSNASSQKQQKLLSSCATFPSILYSTSLDQSKKAESIMEKSYLLVDYEKRIKTHHQFPVDSQTKHTYNDTLKQCDRFAEMVYLNKSISLPNELMYTKLSSMQSQLKKLKNENSCLNDFFQKVASLQKEI